MVRVDGGADQLREPRLPKLPPPPIRASAKAGARASKAASAREISDPRLSAKKRDIVLFPICRKRRSPSEAMYRGRVTPPQWREAFQARLT